MNRPARFTVADLRRAIRAAALSGPAYVVEIAPDGTIRIVPQAGGSRTDGRPVEPIEDIVF